MKQGWQIKDFELCLDKTKTTTKLKSSLYGEQGAFPIVSQEKELISGYWDKEEDVFKHKTPIVVFGDHTKVVKYIDFDFVIGADGVKILSPKPFLNPKYFYYWVCSVQIPSHGYARHYRYLKEHQVPVPNLSEQQRIVALLDAEFAKTDALKANAEKNLQNAKDLFQAALKKELEPKEGWNTKELGEVGTFQRGGNFLKSDFVEEGYPCIHYGQIHMRFGTTTYKHLTCIPETLALSKAKIAKKGDVIIAITSEDVEGSCKCTAWMGDYDIAIGAHTAIFHHTLDPVYVSYYLKTPAFNKAKEAYTHGFKVVEIRPADIAKITISFPSLSEQQSIVARLDALNEKCKTLQANYEKTLNLCDDLKQALLKKAFNGEI